MPFQSKAQAGAMFAAAQGKSNIGIPKSVGQEFVSASKGEPTSPLPEYMDAQRGHKAKTHRGRRSKGKGPKPTAPKTPSAHQAEAQTHIANAAKAPTPAASLGHLFKAVRSMHAAKQASTPAPAQPSDNDGDEPGQSTGGY